MQETFVAHDKIEGKLKVRKYVKMKTAFQTSVQYSNCLVFAAGSISTSSKRFSIFSTPVAKAKSQGVKRETSRILIQPMIGCEKYQK